ncbi:uncharacterized protein BDR25DRAFT_358039 [Lindgomyces ingoldianus]|uniref:Uncharacterized protein n=1 Tax=Lindgomyces ingoldianus TaxID=673940 RepID=A0ACB6QML9_9PLEO|nr:uncharacterized protein BDR25DRAFT_358039 [Lindgomyces ingoldianus]KAF2467770.1 hypothetical protein BDR25DRAFT_358039 [Lindgomyces ingoldianus]
MYNRVRAKAAGWWKASECASTIYLRYRYGRLLARSVVAIRSDWVSGFGVGTLGASDSKNRLEGTLSGDHSLARSRRRDIFRTTIVRFNTPFMIISDILATLFSMLNRLSTE